MRSLTRALTMTVCAAGALLMAPVALADVTGTLIIGTTSNEQIQISNNPADILSFLPLFPNPNFDVNGATTLTEDGGTLITATEGTIFSPLGTATVFPVNNFITFLGSNTDIDFTLTAIGPGSANTSCAALASIGQSCSPTIGSPFDLTYLGPDTTVVAFAVAGTVTDSTAAISNWSGSFAETLTASALAIQDDLAGTCTAGDKVQLYGYDPGITSGGAGSCTGTIISSHSGTFTASVASVPEPGTVPVLMIGVALVAFSTIRRKRA